MCRSRPWVERQIAPAQAEGSFDDLPGAGKSLPRRSENDSVYEWVIAKARKENIDLFGMLPPGLALRKEREDLPHRAAALPSEAAVRALGRTSRPRRGRPLASSAAPGGRRPRHGGRRRTGRGVVARAPGPRAGSSPAAAPDAAPMLTGGGSPARIYGMRFVLEVDLEAGVLAGEARAAELGRILRYWAGALKQMPPLSPGIGRTFPTATTRSSAPGAWRTDRDL